MTEKLQPPHPEKSENPLLEIEETRGIPCLLCRDLFEANGIEGKCPECKRREEINQNSAMMGGPDDWRAGRRESGEME